MLRNWFCKLPLALVRGYRVSDLVLGKKNARLTCPTCKGLGSIESSGEPCPSCAGKRFVAPFLEVLWRGTPLAELLDLSIDEVLGREGRIPKLHELLQRLADAGLGYLSLGQPTATLSTGEFQRIRIVAELRSSAVPTIFCLDEPTIGLSMEEAQRLLTHLRKLTAAGHTIIAIEHNPLLVAASDWIVELGPGAGRNGGEIMYQGLPPPFSAPT